MNKKDDALSRSTMTKSLNKFVHQPFFVTLFYLLVSLAWLMLTQVLLVPWLSDAMTLHTTWYLAIGMWLVGSSIVIYINCQKSPKADTTSPPSDFFQQLFYTNPEAQIIYDPRNLAILGVNEQAKKFLQLTNKQQVPSNLKSCFRENKEQKEILAWLSQPYTGAELQSEPLTWNVKSGRRAELTIIQSKPLENQPGFRYLQIKNSVKFRQQIIDIQRAATRLDLAREVSGMGCWEIDLNRQEVFCCDNICELLGLGGNPNDPIPYTQFKQMVKTDIFCEIAEQLAEHTDQEEIMQHKSLVDSQGRTRHVIVHAHYYRHDKRGSIIGTLLDETERAETHETIEQQRLQWNNLVETLPEGIAIIQNSRLVYANQAVLKMSNADNLEQLCAKPLIEFIADKNVTDVTQRMKNIYAKTGQTEGFFPRTLVKLNGEKFEAEVAARLIKFEGEPAIQIVVRDLTAPIKAKEALEAANRRLSSLSSKTLTLLESERKHISGELHDDVGQSLTAIKLAVQWLTRRLTDEKLIQKAQDIQDISSGALETVRNLSLMLRPAQLDSQGLPQAISWQVGKLLADSAIEFQLDDESYQELQDKNTELIAFRVIQESITNIVRHAQATTVAVKLCTEHDKFTFSITDDGIGFDVEQQSDSVGLVNMKERVELANGSISIRSLFGIGTVLNVSLPLDNKQTQNSGDQIE